jgi:hypothetical protein
MTQVNLPNRNVTGANLWDQVEDNDDAIVNVVNGDLDNSNIAAAADINGSKLLDGSVSAAKLGTDSVTNVKINASAVNTAEIADDAVTGDKIADATTGTATNSSGVSGTITARKYADGLVLIEGSATKTTGTWASSAALTFTLGTLPAGFRPSEGTATIRATSNSALGNIGFNYVSVGTDGVVTLWVVAPFSEAVTTVSLAGITYRAA